MPDDIDVFNVAQRRNSGVLKRFKEVGKGIFVEYTPPKKREQKQYINISSLFK